LEEKYQDTALPVSITLFQGLPKLDKMELIIQKAVELGVDGITPVQMARSIVKLDEKKAKDKVARWQSISESAAKQSKRVTIPTINQVVSLNNAVKTFSEFDLVLLPYECKNGMQDTVDALKLIKKEMKIAVLIGPEGGFDLKEVSLAEEFGAKAISLGKRILRTETAAITTLSMLMLHAEINL
jgi:16S rRNA (uracil1498-N3)-methyltransferase